MSSPELPESIARDSAEADLASYRQLSRLAVLGLVLGVAGSLAIAFLHLWLLPAIGAVVSAVAVWRITASPDLFSGRRLAIIGLFLSLFFCAAALSTTFSRQWWLRHDARQVAELWFSLLAAGEPEKAHQLELDPHNRQSLRSNLWEFYRNTPGDAAALRRFVDDPLVHLLLALGDWATVRYWGTEDDLVDRSAEAEYIVQIYSVTYGNPSERRTFFVRTVLKRMRNADTGAIHWKLYHREGGIHPFQPDRDQ